MAQVLNRIKLEAAQKRIRSKEFFADFDQLRKGEVTEAQFRRVLSLMNLTLTASEMDSICNRFRKPSGLVSYKDFQNELDSVFLDEKESSPVKAAQRQLGGQQLTVTEMERIKAAMEEFKQVMKVKRIMAKPLLQDFDKSNNGHVSASQFERVLTSTGLLPRNSELISLMVRLYTDSHLGVNYQRFCTDIDQVDTVGSLSSGPIQRSFEPQAKPQAPQDLTSMRFFDTRSASNVNPLQVEEKLRAEVAMKGVRVTEFFRDFDKLRKGVVKENHFRSAIGMSNLRVSAEELQSLIDKYIVNSVDIDYSSFCRFIEAKPGIYEKDPEFKPTESVNTLAARRQLLDFSQQETEQLIAALEKFQKIMRNRRVHMRPIFQDFDIAKTGHVSRTQFTRVLNQLSLAPSQEELRLILKRYLDKGNMEEVNYMDFCTDVDKPEDIFAPEETPGIDVQGALENRRKNFPNLQYTTKPVMTGPIIKDTPEDLSDLLAKIRKIVKLNRIRLLEFIRDFDKLRTGIVTKSQLRSALSMAKIDLSDSEFNLISTEYQVDSQRVCYTRFIDEIEMVFTQKNLEKTNVDFNPANTETKYGVQPLSRLEKSLSDNALNKFRNFMVNKFLDIKSHFQEWDRHNTHKITPKQFRQVLAQFNFTFTDEEFNAVCRRYNKEGYVKYQEFVEDAKPKQFRESYPSSSVSQRTTGSFNIQNPYCMNTEIPEDVVTVLKRVLQGVKVKRIRPQEFMQEHDPIRKGVIPKSKFRSALDNMKLELSAKDLDLLEAYFARGSDLVRYSEFTEACDSIFTTKGLEKNPQVRPSSETYYLDPRDSLTQAEETGLEECLTGLGYQVATRRLYLKPFFQDKDKVNVGWVSPTRFRSIMSFAGIQISDRHYYLLTKRFSHKRNEFNYLEFCNTLARYSGDDQLF